MSTEEMTDQEAFDVYVRRKVEERNKQNARLGAWVEKFKRSGSPFEDLRFWPTVPSPPEPFERDVEIRAIQLGML